MALKSVSVEPHTILATAFRRIGTTEKRNAHWVLGFINEEHDVWKMNPSQLLGAVQDVTAFAILASSVPPNNLARTLISNDFALMTAKLNFKDGTGLHSLYPDQDELKQLQLFIAKAIDELLSKGVTRFPEVTVELSVHRSVPGAPPLSPQSGGPFFVLPTMYDAKEILSAFRFRLAHVLAAVSETIAQCPMAGRSRKCLGLFLKRRQQVYCRQACGSVVRMRRKRTTNKE